MYRKTDCLGAHCNTVHHIGFKTFFQIRVRVSLYSMCGCKAGVWPCPSFASMNEYQDHKINMEIDLQSLFGLHVTWCAQLYSLAGTPQLPPAPRIWTRITRALLVSKDRRHLFVTPWSRRYTRTSLLSVSLAFGPWYINRIDEGV